MDIDRRMKVSMASSMRLRPLIKGINQSQAFNVNTILFPKSLIQDLGLTCLAKQGGDRSELSRQSLIKYCIEDLLLNPLQPRTRLRKFSSPYGVSSSKLVQLSIEVRLLHRDSTKLLLLQNDVECDPKFACRVTTT